MADAGATPSGRIKPSDADQVLIAAMVSVAAGIHDDTDRETALHLMQRSLPMITSSTRMQGLRPVAEAILAAAPRRRRPGDGARDWMLANFDLSRAISRDALRQALSKVEV